MATGNNPAVGRQLATLFQNGSVRGLTDGQLLERFTTGPDKTAELAFAALVERHGPMVLRVAQGVLADPHDAQDAFQATFLVLIAKARGLWTRDSLGPWLHQVAHRTASCIRATAARRRRLDRRLGTIVEAVPAPLVDDSTRIIHEEINRLPERYRVPVVLCDLEGQTHEEAARALGWPVGTVKSRQARARDRLRSQLTRRGVALGLVLPGLLAPVPVTLLQITTVAAVRSLTSRAIVPGSAAALAREVLGTMKLAGLLKVGSIVLALGTVSGVGLVAQDGGNQATPVVEPAMTEVKPGKLDFHLTERGVVEPSRRTLMINHVEGSRAIRRILPEGTQVQKGELVAELESNTLKDQLVNQEVTTTQAEALFKQARLTREVSEFAVKEYVEGVGVQDLASLQAKVTTAQTAIDKARSRLERTKVARRRLDVAINHRAGPETPADIVADLNIADQLDAAELDISTRDADFQMAQGQQKVFKEYTRGKAIRSLELDVEKARLEEVNREAAWRREQAQMGRLNRQIEQCKLLAPRAGLLVYANDPRSKVGGPGTIEEGAMVRERQIIAQVVDPADPMRINAKIPESLVDQVHPGQRVQIKVDALPDQVLTGVVQTVAPMADVIAFRGENKKVYTTEVQIDQVVPNLRPGMVAVVEIAVFDLDNVLSVPVDAVVGVDGTDQVAVRTATGAVEWRVVTLGKANDQAVEVKQGLRDGDHVLMAPITRLSEAMKAKLPPRPTRPPEPK